MGKLIGYMVTWTTYGSWLQGDKRGYVKNGKILEPSAELEKRNRNSLKYEPVKLNALQKQIVGNAIRNKAEELGQKILALVVYSNHVHLVTRKTLISVEKSVSYYKNAARVALRNKGFKKRLWSRGYDKRLFFNEEKLKKRIEYVLRH